MAHEHERARGKEGKCWVIAPELDLASEAMNYIDLCDEHAAGRTDAHDHPYAPAWRALLEALSREP